MGGHSVQVVALCVAKKDRGLPPCRSCSLSFPPPSSYCGAPFLGLNTWPRVFVCRVHSSRHPTGWTARVTQPFYEENNKASDAERLIWARQAGTPFFLLPVIWSRRAVREEFWDAACSNHSVLMAAAAGGSELLLISIHHGATNRRKRSNSDGSNRSGERGSVRSCCSSHRAWLSTCDGRRPCVGISYIRCRIGITSGCEVFTWWRRQ